MKPELAKLVVTFEEIDHNQGFWNGGQHPVEQTKLERAVAYALTRETDRGKGKSERKAQGDRQLSERGRSLCRAWKPGSASGSIGHQGRRRSVVPPRLNA